MLARVFLAIAVGAFASACAQIPDLTFVDADAPTDGSVPQSDGGGGEDVTAGGDGTTPPSDSSMTSDAPNPTDGGSSDSGPCPPANAPAGAGCCGDGKTPCIGPACAMCKTTAWCSCSPGEYCCAAENPHSGKVTGPQCSSMPTGPMCPTQ